MSDLATITNFNVLDIRYPTSKQLDGADPRHLAPDYSAVVLELSTSNSLVGRGLIFTLGDGNSAVIEEVKTLKRFLIGRSLEEFKLNPGNFFLALTQHHQLRWHGQCGLYRMACGAVINALWDLWAKDENLPMWELLCSLSPKKLVQCVDWFHLGDVLTPDEAYEMLIKQEKYREERIAQFRKIGPKYYLTRGWSGQKLDYIRLRCSEMKKEGCDAFKAKVGRGHNLEEDRNLLAAMREEIGPECLLLTDANQNLGDWKKAAEYMIALAEFKPFFIEEPIAADDVFGYAALRKALQPHNIGVAGGEHADNQVIFKQLLANAGLTHCQIDSARVAGVNENIAIMLLAAKCKVPVWPHGGGIGLCHKIVHLSLFDQICVSGPQDQRVEYIDFLQEGVFVKPISVANGHYMTPTESGWGLEFEKDFLKNYQYPAGSECAQAEAADQLACSQAGAPEYAKLWLRN